MHTTKLHELIYEAHRGDIPRGRRTRPLPSGEGTTWVIVETLVLKTAQAKARVWLNSRLKAAALPTNADLVGAHLHRLSFRRQDDHR